MSFRAYDVSSRPVGKRSLDSRRLLTFALLAAFLWSLLQVSWGSRILHPGGAHALLEIGAGLLHPAFSSAVLGNGLRDSWRTVAYAVAGLTVAIAIGFPLGVMASGALSRGIWKRRAASGVIRFVIGRASCRERVYVLV